MWTDADRDEREIDLDEPAEDLAEPGPGESGDPLDACDSWEQADSSAYWRRRFLILCGGVAALGLCAWLFPGGHPARQPSAAARASMAAQATRQMLPAAATGKAWAPGQSASPAPRPAAAAQPTRPTRPTRPRISLAYHPHAAAFTSAAAAGKACTGIVLSLFTSQPSYSAGERPEFKVYAVSTAKSGCTLRYGAGAVQVVVTRPGQVVWNSAACQPQAAQPVTFAPGVPQVLALTWDRGAAGPAGCAGSLPAGTAATLSAVVLNGGRSSKVTTFKLRAGPAPKGSQRPQSGQSQPGKPQQGKTQARKPRPGPAPSAPSRQYRPR